MPNEITLENIKELLGKVKHPAIDDSLLKLGMIKNMEMKNKEITVVLAFPFENIPIKDQIMASVKEPLDKLNLDTKIETTVMNQDELQNFLSREQKNWRG